jgi:hypothetical protein
MVKMTREEFDDRAGAIQRAQKIFIESGLTDNYNKAFEAYQSIFAEREREILLSDKYYGNRPRTVFDDFVRPVCPECGEPMLFRQIANTPGVLTQLICSSKFCDVVIDSEHSVEEWVEELKTQFKNHNQEEKEIVRPEETPTEEQGRSSSWYV